MAELKAELKELSEEIHGFLRLRTWPVGLEFLDNAEDLSKFEKLHRPESPLSWCQAVSIARYLGRTVGVTIDDIVGPACIFRLGFAPVSPQMWDGTLYAGIWMKTKEDAAKYVQTLPSLPVGKYEAAVVSPLISEKITPNIVLIYANTAQMNLLLNGLQWENYERLQFFFTGESSCADAFAECYKTGKPQLTIPCMGERMFAFAQEDELELALPTPMMKKMVEGIRGLRRSHIIAYPIPYGGFQLSLDPLFKKTYPNLKEWLAEVKTSAKQAKRKKCK